MLKNVLYARVFGPFYKKGTRVFGALFLKAQIAPGGDRTRDLGVAFFQRWVT